MKPCVVLGLMHTGTNVWSDMLNCTQANFWKHFPLFWEQKVHLLEPEKFDYFVTSRNKIDWINKMKGHGTFEYTVKNKTIVKIGLLHSHNVNYVNQFLGGQMEFLEKTVSENPMLLSTHHRLYEKATFRLLLKNRIRGILKFDDICKMENRPWYNAQQSHHGNGKHKKSC